MQPRSVVPLWVLASLLMWLEADAQPMSVDCHSTTLRITIFCTVEVHHTGSLPNRYSTEIDREQLKRQICPCKDFEVHGPCPTFVHNIAKRYSPDIMCVDHRNSRPQPEGTLADRADVKDEGNAQ